MSSPFVTFNDNSVSKTYLESEVEIEFDKANRLWQLFQSSDEVSFPQPLAMSQADRSIIYAFAPADGPFSQRYVRYLQTTCCDEDFLACVDVAARALATIHMELQLPTRSTWRAPATFHEAARSVGLDFEAEFLDRTPHAFLHGDYSFANIHYVDSLERRHFRVMLYDPSPNGHTTSSPDEYASIYLDLGAFFSSLNGRLPLLSLATSRWSRVATVKHRFLSTYQQMRQLEIDSDLVEFVGYAIKFASVTRWHSSGLARRFAMSLLYNSFKGNTTWIRRINGTRV